MRADEVEMRIVVTETDSRRVLELMQTQLKMLYNGGTPEQLESRLTRVL